MKKRNVWLWFLAGMLAALLLAGIGFGMVDHAEALTVSAVPAGVTVNVFENSPAVIPAADFSSDGFDPDSMFFSFWGGYLGGGNVDTCFKAPVDLPQWADMVDMWTSLYDNDPSGNIWVDFYRVDNYTGTVDVLASVSTQSEGDYIQTPWDWIDSTRNIVYYPQYSYYLGACAESNLDRLYSVRIYFTVNKVMLPIVFNQ